MKQLTFITQDVPEPRPGVRDLPEREQPVNRLREVGPTAISLTELLACVLLGKDALHQAETLLVRFKTLTDLVRASEVELLAVEGIGPAQAARLKAACELGRRLLTEAIPDRYQIHSPADIANLLMAEMSWLEREHFVGVFLDTRNRVLDQQTLYTGTLNTSIVRIGEVFQEAVRRNCAGVIVAHNHPSGDPAPSPEDVALTRRLVEAGKLLEVEVLDHLVIGHNRYVSLRERGLGFEAAFDERPAVTAMPKHLSETTDTCCLCGKTIPASDRPLCVECEQAQDAQWQDYLAEREQAR